MEKSLKTIDKAKAVKVYFCLDSSELTLSELSELVAMPPDEGWDLDSEYSVLNNTKRHKFSRWQINEFCEAPAFVDDAAIKLIERLSPATSKLKSSSPKIRRSLTAEITAVNTLFGFGLPKEVISYLAEVDADLDTNWVVRAYTEGDLEAMGMRKTK